MRPATRPPRLRPMTYPICDLGPRHGGARARQRAYRGCERADLGGQCARKRGRARDGHCCHLQLRYFHRLSHIPSSSAFSCGPTLSVSGPLQDFTVSLLA